MAINFNFRSWFGSGSAVGESNGKQIASPSAVMVPDSSQTGIDGALQISAVWACIELRANTIASLPFFAYDTINGEKELARNSSLYTLLHESPNSRMTPLEFWRAMIMNHDLRGNAYARLDRNNKGEVIAMWPMPADQVMPVVLGDGSMVYEYTIGSDIAIISDKNCLHLKNLGNGTTGLSKLDFMRSTTDEVAKMARSAEKVFGTNGKPTGILMLDKVLTKEQRAALETNFAGMAQGNSSRLFLLEANMKYEQLSMSPTDQQLLESRKYSVEEICRWFATPPVLVYHSNVTTWGSGIDSILDGWYKLVIRPMLVSIEQATRKRVMTPRQRASMSIEISFDALLRGNPTQRAEMYSKALQNGYMTRAEVRQLEGWPKMDNTDQLTAQSNLLPLEMLGQVPAPTAPKEVMKSADIYTLQTKEQDQRHTEIIDAIKSGSEVKAPSVIVDMGKAIINVTNEPAQAPVVQVSNIVNPTPVNVRVINDVTPTPVEVMANFEATIQPATVELTIPARKTEGTVTRNDKGEIIKTVTIESDA